MYIFKMNITLTIIILSIIMPFMITVSTVNAKGQSYNKLSIYEGFKGLHWGMSKNYISNLQYKGQKKLKGISLKFYKKTDISYSYHGFKPKLIGFLFHKQVFCGALLLFKGKNLFDKIKNNLVNNYNNPGKADIKNKEYMWLLSQKLGSLKTNDLKDKSDLNKIDIGLRLKFKDTKDITFLMILHKSILRKVIKKFVNSKSHNQFNRNKSTTSYTNLTSKERKYFSNIAEKISENIIPRDPVVRRYAIQHTWKRRIHSEKYNETFTSSKFSQILLLYQSLRNKGWKYVSDPLDDEYVASPKETLKVGLAGDCEDFAVFMASMIGAIGGHTRVVVAFGPRGGHAYPEIYMGKKQHVIQKKINTVGSIAPYMTEKYLDDYKYRYHTDNGSWLNLDWSANFPGGSFFNSYISVAVYPNGKFELIEKKSNWVRLTANRKTKKLQSLLTEFSKAN